MIQLVEVYMDGHGSPSGRDRHPQYSLREVYINPKHVVAIRTDTKMNTKLQEGLLPDELDYRQSFTKIFLDRGQAGIDLVVVGESALISQKLGIPQRELLKG